MPVDTYPGLGVARTDPAGDRDRQNCPTSASHCPYGRQAPRRGGDKRPRPRDPAPRRPPLSTSSARQAPAAGWCAHEEANTPSTSTPAPTAADQAPATASSATTGTSCASREWNDGPASERASLSGSTTTTNHPCSSTGASPHRSSASPRSHRTPQTDAQPQLIRTVHVPGQVRNVLSRHAGATRPRDRDRSLQQGRFSSVTRWALTARRKILAGNGTDSTAHVVLGDDEDHGQRRLRRIR